MKVGDDDDLAIVRDWDRENKKGRYIDYDDDKLTAQLQRGGEVRRMKCQKWCHT